MPRTSRLSREFFAQPTLQVARQLLGCILVHEQKINGKKRRLSGIIVETEAYCGERDLGCHAKAGRTPRTAVMYGPPGHAYVYFTYGNHWLFNCITRAEGEPHAVLLRAIRPLDGIDLIARRRAGQAQAHWANGPGKLTQALGIDGRHNGVDLASRTAIIFIEAGPQVPARLVKTGPRIGLHTVPEPWKSKPWRFLASIA
ncbi:MAG TPA: DNA-3-methyladenine glycosylase [Anaerolineales bacterium]|nr:DNA-3-methyladenine glycosylase [Anaerolineales bacterium]